MEQHCKGCEHENSCEQIYNRLCNTQGPSVLRGVLEVFLVPLVLFVATVVFVEVFMADKINSEGLTVLVAVAAAAVLLSVYIALLKMWRYKNQN